VKAELGAFLRFFDAVAFTSDFESECGSIASPPKDKLLNGPLPMLVSLRVFDEVRAQDGQ
jgi:hypothetical protein